MRRVTVFIPVTMALLCATGHAATPADAGAARAIVPLSDPAFRQLVALRRDLHQHPEVSGQEARTAANVAARLSALGLEVRRGLYGHSVVGILRGAKPGRTVAWRSELDALAGDSPDPVPFRSRNAGAHHGCGHDVHIAIALGIAEVLAGQRDQLHGQAVFIFQPEEESFSGAKAMLDAGLLKSLPVDEIYGVHVTGLPVGQIAVRPGEMFAYPRQLRIALKEGLSAAELGQVARLVKDTLTRNPPLASPAEIQRMVDPNVGVTAAGTAFRDFLVMDEPHPIRVSPGTVNLEGDLYETQAARLDTLIPRVTQALQAAGHGDRLLGVSFTRENPTVFNDEPLTRTAIQTLQQALGAGAVQPVYGQAPFFNDDFAYFQQQVPGVYFFLGGSHADKGLNAMNHLPGFAVDEDSIRLGVRAFSTLVAARLGR